MTSIKDTVRQDIERAESIQSENKYEQVLAQYNTDVDDAEVREEVKKIIAEKAHENDTPEVKKFLLGSVELTTLHTTDSDVSVMQFTENVNRFDEVYPDLPHVATICVFPCFAEVVNDTLEVEGVNIACVSGSFPSSQALIEVKVAETALAIKDGANEIDIVMPVGKFLTGDLVTASNIKKASILSMYAGADYIKTSTGKEKVSATPEAVYVMCQAIKEYYDKTGIQIGLKPAGGINTVMDAVIYYTIVKEVLGEKWLTNQWFRLGTSRLANILLSEIVGEEVKFF